MRNKRSIGLGKLTIAAMLGYVAMVATLRQRYINWGTTKDEQLQPLPGDELMHHASANHALTIHAPVKIVWQWLVQIGQDKAGFYSYSFLENLVRADIHNANRIVPEWQHLKAGDTIRLGSKKSIRRYNTPARGCPGGESFYSAGGLGRFCIGTYRR